MYEVQMPKFGATMKEGEINKWFVEPGDKVKKGDALCEISTEKITNTLESYVSGTVKELLLEEGDIAPISEVIAYIEED